MAKNMYQKRKERQPKNNENNDDKGRYKKPISTGISARKENHPQTLIK